MQGGWITRQGASVKQLNKIKPFLNEVKNNKSGRILQSLLQIMNFYFGSHDAYGILHRFGNEFSNYQTLQWASQLQQLLQHILPGSPMFNQLLRSEESKIIINSAYAPYFIQSSFFEKSRPVNYRITHSGIQIAPIDAYFMMLAYSIYHSQPILAPTSQYEHLILDEFYSSLCRNPLLVVLYRNIEYFYLRQKKYLQKIVFITKTFLMDELLIKFEQDHNKNMMNFDNNQRIFNQSIDSDVSIMSKKPIQLKYRLKLHHIHALYLVIKFAPEQVNNLSKYCQALTDYFISVKPDKYCLQAMMRLWLYGMSIRPGQIQNVQNQVIECLKKANPRDGWYYLKRYSPHQIESTSENVTVFNVQTAYNLLKLIEKQSNWTSNPSYLFTFACFFKYLHLKSLYYHQFSNVKRSQADQKQNNVIQKVFAVIVNNLNVNLIDALSKIRKRNHEQYRQSVNIILDYQKIIQNYFLQFFRSRNRALSENKMMKNRQLQLPKQLIFKQIVQSQIKKSEQTSKVSTSDAIEKVTGEAKRKLVDFYRRQPKECWDVPIQYNQSTILYYIFFIIAKLLSFIIPGRRVINIRFLANPITLIGFIVIIIFIYMMSK